MLVHRGMYRQKLLNDTFRNNVQEGKLNAIHPPLKSGGLLATFPINVAADKVAFMQNILRYIPADDYIMVGNRKGGFSPDDEELARLAGGWRFISEKDFASGVR